MTQKIDKDIFIDAALSLLEQYSVASITFSEIAQESGHSRKAFYDNMELEMLWDEVVDKLAQGDSMSYVYKREKRCARKISQKIAKLIEKKMKEKGEL